jgi:hypothetical protein
LGDRRYQKKHHTVKIYRICFFVNKNTTIIETGVTLVVGTVEVNSVASAYAFLKVQKGANVNYIDTYEPNGKVSNYGTIAKK